MARDTRTQLYRHYDKDGALLYVGISLSAVSRLCEHKGSSWFYEIDTVRIETFPTREDALEAERMAIDLEEPRHNLAHANGERSHWFMDLVRYCLLHNSTAAGEKLEWFFPRNILPTAEHKQLYDLAMLRRANQTVTSRVDNG